MMVLVKSVDKSQHIFIIHIIGNYFVLPWFRFKYAEYKGSKTYNIFTKKATVQKDKTLP